MNCRTFAAAAVFVAASFGFAAEPKPASDLASRVDERCLVEDFAGAEKLLRTARAAVPDDLEVLGQWAAFCKMHGRGDEFASLLKTHESSARFRLALAAAFDRQRCYSDATAHYRRTLELEPENTAALANFGMMQLKLGEETAARESLGRAVKAGSTDARVSASLDALKHLDGYATTTTEHYILRYDAATDSVLAALAAQDLEDIHAELKAQFAYEPPGKTLVEIFSSQAMFSARATGAADLHAHGACTGRVVLIVSPTAKGLPRPYGWSRVLRHELTHAFNWAQTDYRCPHWLTEGLAVTNERTVRPHVWARALRNRASQKRLLDLSSLSTAFVRPNDVEEWNLAYCQSHLYVDHLIRLGGIASIRKLLEAYRTGSDTSGALKSAYGVDAAAFEAGYRKYVDEVVASYPGPARSDTPMTLQELERLHRETPNDSYLAARLAEAYLATRREDASKLVDEVLRLEPNHPAATAVKIRLLLLARDSNGAKSKLEAALEKHPDDAKLLIAAARVHLDTRDSTAAARALERGRRVAPLEYDWLPALARLYKATNEPSKRNAVLSALVEQDPDDRDSRLDLARTALESGDPKRAERLSWEALRIDPSHAATRAILLDSLSVQRKDVEYERMRRTFR